MSNVFGKLMSWGKHFFNDPKTKEILKKVLWAIITIIIESFRPEGDKDKDKGKTKKTKPKPS
ncbi:hypothetical protein ACIP97_13930 [Peribacillus frigoritolerans]|uniref:hypothetical protein n=1 Tax=Peribacillus frigoritolerans TaxID=450367 RepID=UPI0037FEC2A3